MEEIITQQNNSNDSNNTQQRINYTELAKLTNLSTRHISRILKGRVKRPGHETMKKLASAMSLDPEELEDRIKQDNLHNDNKYNGGKVLSQEDIDYILSMRGVHGMTTRKCAKIAGISRETVSRIWTSER